MNSLNIERSLKNARISLFIYRRYIIGGAAAFWMLPEVPGYLRFRSNYIMPQVRERQFLKEQKLIRI